MGIPTSEVGYTSAIPRREGHEVSKGHVGHWIKKILYIATNCNIVVSVTICIYRYTHTTALYVGCGFIGAWR